MSILAFNLDEIVTILIVNKIAHKITPLIIIGKHLSNTPHAILLLLNIFLKLLKSYSTNN
ncbi:hypothetical protein A0H76_728 [Hepatospora eriocheir]|uniref:Uncharacterized protein n=1 Tax=Hepatospora eriocheir TaxID=1081669 RepID=A0A1X0Q707_9MICR|nr:hypothetical protein A0H76_728 [Hepatospora eriocheir]